MRGLPYRCRLALPDYANKRPYLSLGGADDSGANHRAISQLAEALPVRPGRLEMAGADLDYHSCKGDLERVQFRLPAGCRLSVLVG